MRYVIVGAGVAGLTAAYKLLEKGQETVVLEKESDIGGLSRGFSYGSFNFDIGPHRFFTDKREVQEFINFVLKGDYSYIDRINSIYLLDRYFPWPLRPSLIAKLPISLCLKIILDIFSRVESEKEDFKSVIISKFGKTLYDLVFKDYTEKFCFLSGDELHRDWIKASLEKAIIDKKLKVDSLFGFLNMIYKSMGPRMKFLYPRGGCVKFAQNLEKMIYEKGGRIIKGVRDISLDFKNNKIASLRYCCFHEDEVELDHLIYTAPLPLLAKQLKLRVPDLEYLNSIIYNIEVKKPLENPNQWIYFGGRDLSFSRVSFPVNFDSKNVPPGRDSLCLEATCRDKSLLWDNPESIKERFIEDLTKVNLCQKKDIEGIHIEKITHTYPIYKLNYLDEIVNIKKQLSEFNNLTCLGRTGTFWYNNMDESIGMSLEAIDNIGR